MSRLCVDYLRSLVDRARLLRSIFADAARFVRHLLTPKVALAARVLFLEKQLGAFVERQHKPRRLDDASRIVMALTSRFFHWKDSLVVVDAGTLVRWSKDLFRLFWKWKSRLGRPKLPLIVRRLIRQMLCENPTWGERRVAFELFLKLGLLVSPRTVRRYWPLGVPPSPRGRHVSPQRWRTFVRNHLPTTIACDFLTVNVRLHMAHVFVVIELETRRLLHFNVTRHPTAEWTIQQLREAISAEHGYRFLIHDRDGIFSPDVDRCLKNMGVRPLKSPPRAPKANAFCERVIGTIRRECLDCMIFIHERQLARGLREWVQHYNRARPHSSLGPGLPEPHPGLPVMPQSKRHVLPHGYRVAKTSVLAGLHHEYRLEKDAA